MDMIERIRTAISPLQRRADDVKTQLETYVSKTNLTAADEQRMNALTDEAKTIHAELAPLKERELELLDYQARANNAKGSPVGPGRGRGLSEARGRVLRNLDALPHGLNDSVRGAAYNLIEGADGEDIARHSGALSDPDYLSAFLKLMRDPARGHLEFSGAEREAFTAVREEQRAMSVGTNSAGGYAVPFVLDPAIVITGTGSINPMRSIATVKTVPAGNYHPITAGQVSASWDTEGSAVSDDAPTLTQPSIPSFLARVYIAASFEAFQDIADLANEAMKLMADAKDNLEAAAHWTGTGSGQPKGIVTAIGANAPSRVSPGTGGTLAIGDPFLVQNALPARHSKKATFASNIAVINKNRQNAYAQNSANSIWTDLGGDIPAKFLGRNYVEASAMSSSLTTGQDVLIYGNFEKYYVVDVVNSPTVEFLPNLFDQATGRPSSQRGMMLWFRQGADTVDVDAFRLLRL